MANANHLIPDELDKLINIAVGSVVLGLGFVNKTTKACTRGAISPLADLAKILGFPLGSDQSK